MASYFEFARNIGEGDIITAYNNVLTDINYCINLFEDLETGRTFTEIMTDWLAGERDKINIEAFPVALHSLKYEIENGMKLYIDLSFKKQYLKRAQTSQGPKLHEVRHVDDMTPQWGIKQKLMNQFDELLAVVADIQTPERMQPQNRLYKYIQDMGSYYGNSDLSDRAKMYETAKVLYLTLNQNEVLKILQDNHATISELINRIDSEILKANNPGQQENKNAQKACSEKLVSQQNNNPEGSIESVQLSEENDQVYNMEDGKSIKNVQNSQSSNIASAEDIYRKTLSDEQKELASLEPAMSEKQRDKLATRAAVRACKIFLEENLRFSDSQANHFINDIQS